VSSGYLNVNGVTIDCLDGDMKILETYSYGLVE